MTFTGSPFLFLIMIFLLNVISVALATLKDFTTNMYLPSSGVEHPTASSFFSPPPTPDLSKDLIQEVLSQTCQLWTVLPPFNFRQ